jgi:ABC-type amino acid transport substrate-binding protein
MAVSLLLWVVWFHLLCILLRYREIGLLFGLGKLDKAVSSPVLEKLNRAIEATSSDGGGTLALLTASTNQPMIWFNTISERGLLPL